MKRKTLTVKTGTEVIMCAPTHPFMAAWCAKRYIEKIIASSDSEFEVNLNQREAVEVINLLAPKNDIKVKYLINGKTASFKEVIADFDRGIAFIKSLSE